MTDQSNTPVVPQDTTLAIEIANTAPEGSDQNQSVSINLADIPADARMELLRSAVRTAVTNRVNVAMVRNRAQRAPFTAWAAYDAAQAADPMQTTVAKPEGERPTGEAPAALDPIAKANEAIADLLKGELRQQAKKGEGKSRAPKDPLIAAVTQVVARAVFDSHKAAGTKVPVEGKEPRAYTYPDAVKEVGGDGIAYLNKQIDAKVAAGADRAALEKARDSRYINPAKVMLGLNQTKAQAELPSIL
jgi:hypothetical protein